MEKMADVAESLGERFTHSDYRTWPDEERWEIIEGVPWSMMQSCGTRHQSTVGHFYWPFPGCQVIYTVYCTPSREGTAAHPGGMADNPGGTADHPGGMADHPGGMADHPGGMADHPGGMADHHGGMAVHPGGTADRPVAAAYQVSARDGRSAPP